MSHRLSIFGVFLIGMAAVFFLGSGLHAQEIKIKTEDGIPVVYNPKEPAPLKGQPTKLTIKEDLTIGKDTEDLDYMFSGLQHTQVDDEDRIYVLTHEYIDKEGTQLVRYDVFDPEGRYITKFYHPRAETPQAFRKNKMYVRVEDEVYGIDLLRRYSMIWE